MAYNLMVLLTEEATFSMEQLALRLTKEFASENAKVLLEGHGTGGLCIVVRFGDWTFQIGHEDQPHVVVESKEIAEYYGKGRPDQHRIAGCKRRITVSGDDDPNMDHFNDYCFLTAVFEEYPGVILFDPQAGEFVEGQGT